MEKNLLNKWRYKNVNRYSDVFGCKKPKEKEQSEKSKNNKIYASVSVLIDMIRSFSGAEKFGTSLQGELELDAFNAKIDNVFDNIYSQDDTQLHSNNLNYKPLKTLPFSQWNFTPQQCEEMFKEIVSTNKKRSIEVENELKEQFNRKDDDDFIEDEIESELPFSLSHDQNKCIAKMKKHFQSGTQFLGLLHGAPGAGKSTVVRELKTELQTEHRTMHILQTATTGVAATELEEGITINSLFGWYRNKPYIELPETLSDVRKLQLKELLKNVDLLLICGRYFLFCLEINIFLFV